MTISNPLLDRLQRGPILADGAMGTMLYARGISSRRSDRSRRHRRAPRS